MHARATTPPEDETDLRYAIEKDEFVTYLSQ